MSWQEKWKYNSDGQPTSKVTWDGKDYGWAIVPGVGECLCPIKKPKVVESDIWSGRKFTALGERYQITGGAWGADAWNVYRIDGPRLVIQHWASTVPMGKLVATLCKGNWFGCWLGEDEL